MSKKISSYIRLQILAGMANPSPPIGPALGQKGINIMEFCKSFNSFTANIEKGIPIPVIITVYSDKSFTFITKKPPTTFLLKKFVNIEKGSSNTKNNKIGKISLIQIKEIVKIKSHDMTGSNVEAMSRSIIGTARSMGLEIEEPIL